MDQEAVGGRPEVQLLPGALEAAGAFAAYPVLLRQLLPFLLLILDVSGLNDLCIGCYDALLQVATIGIHPYGDLATRQDLCLYSHLAHDA